MSVIPEGFQPSTVGPYSNHCGPILYKRETHESGHLTGWVGVVLEPHHVGGNNRGHGGLLMTLLDEALGMNACFHRDMQPAVTVSMTTHFTGPLVIGQFLKACGRVTHATTTLAFMEGEAWCGDQLVGKASGVWKYLNKVPHV